VRWTSRAPITGGFKPQAEPNPTKVVDKMP
jgi:hypothetical protein